MPAVNKESKTKLMVTVIIFIVLALMLLIPNIFLEEYVDPEVLEAFDTKLLDSLSYIFSHNSFSLCCFSIFCKRLISRQ